MLICMGSNSNNIKIAVFNKTNSNSHTYVSILLQSICPERCVPLKKKKAIP